MTVQGRNEAAERLDLSFRDELVKAFAGLRTHYGQQVSDRDISNFLAGYLTNHLHEREAAERRATVERIKDRLRGLYSIAPSSDDLAIYGLRLSTIEAILDEEEAAR